MKEKSLSTCIKCDKDVPKTYDCEHTEFEEHCKECYIELHYFLTDGKTIE